MTNETWAPRRPSVRCSPFATLSACAGEVGLVARFDIYEAELARKQPRGIWQFADDMGVVPPGARGPGSERVALCSSRADRRRSQLGDAVDRIGNNSPVPMHKRVTIDTVTNLDRRARSLAHSKKRTRCLAVVRNGSHIATRRDLEVGVDDIERMVDGHRR